MIHNSISFTSKIKFVTEAEFINKLPLKELEKNNQYAGYSKQGYSELVESSVIADRGYTDGIYGCTAGTIIGSKMLMFHLNPVPYEGNYQEIEKKLTPYIEEISKEFKKNKFSGILIGGRLTEVSNKLYTYLRELTDRLQVETSVFLGQFIGGKSRIYYSLKDDTYIINAQDKSGKDILTLEDLKNNFNIRKISDKDELYINGEEINRKTIEEFLNS